MKSRNKSRTAVHSVRVAKPHKPGAEEGFGQKTRRVLLTVLRYPSAGKVGIIDESLPQDRGLPNIKAWLEP